MKESSMNPPCVHSCKGLCSALEAAEHREEEAIKEYKQYAMNCDYPDVREILETLILDREKALQLLREKRDMLAVKFSVIDNINDSFF
jgi:rubrerythrin